MPPSDTDKLATAMRTMGRELNRLGNILEAVNKNLVEVGRMMREERERQETKKSERSHCPLPDLEGLGFRPDIQGSGIIIPELPREENPYPFGTVNYMRWAAGMREPAPPEDPKEGD